MRQPYDEDEITDDYGKCLTPVDDDYRFYKAEHDRRNNPLDDDYCKYDE